MQSEYAIETSDLTKIYRSRWTGRRIRAIDEVSLQIPRGAIFGLLGPNGAGKTTFVKTLLSAVHPTRGNALIFGRDARVPESRRPIGYLPENHRFPTYFTGAGMLDFYGALSGLDAARRKVRIPELLDETPRCPIILHFGRRDASIPTAVVEAIADRHPDIPIHLYDAGHGFVSDRRADYDADAARLARLRTLQLFARHGGGRGDI